MLLKFGANPDARDKAGRTAYWRAGGKLGPQEQQKLSPATRQIRALLVNAGANPSILNYRHQSWLQAGSHHR